MRKRGRPPRLPAEAYRGTRVVSFTANVAAREPIFTNPDLVAKHIDFLTRSSTEANCLCLLYCYMPDHAHILIRGLGESSDMKLAMSKYKLLAGIHHRNNDLPKLQEDVHDRVLRYGELKSRAKYIALNPVRGGLVENFVDYPFLGSMAGDPIEILRSIGDSREFG